MFKTLTQTLLSVMVRTDKTGRTLMTDVKRVLAEVMKEKNVGGVLTIPEKSKVIHYMKKEDGTMKRWKKIS